MTNDITNRRYIKNVWKHLEEEIKNYFIDTWKILYNPLLYIFISHFYNFSIFLL